MSINTLTFPADQRRVVNPRLCRFIFEWRHSSINIDCLLSQLARSNRDQKRRWSEASEVHRGSNGSRVGRVTQCEGFHRRIAWCGTSEECVTEECDPLFAGLSSVGGFVKRPGADEKNFDKRTGTWPLFGFAWKISPRYLSLFRCVVVFFRCRDQVLRWKCV